MVLVQAEFTAFTEAERYFKEALREFETVLDALECDLEQHLAEWEGDDQQAYAAVRARWDRSARDLHAELARLHQAIRRAHRNFRSSSTTNMRMWSA